MEPFNVSRPTEMARSFIRFFPAFFGVDRSLNLYRVEIRIKKFLQSLINQDLTPDQWKSLVRRFKSQYKKYFQHKTTFNATDDGWLVGDEFVGQRVTCLFNDRVTQSTKSYGGIISSQDNTILHSIFKKIQPSTYTIIFDDGEISTYNIFRGGKEYYRVGTRILSLSDLYVEREPEPCNDPHQKECIVCMVQCVNSLCVPCGHACMCMGCANRIFAADAKCPICRQHIQRVQNMYYSGKENNEMIDGLKSEIVKLKSDIDKLTTETNTVS
jgi:hypothetical protein